MLIDFRPIDTADPSATGLKKNVWLSDGAHIWGGYHNGIEWVDRDDHPLHLTKRYGQPTLWMPMLPEDTQILPTEKDDAGQQLLGAIDEDRLPVQGSMWVHGPEGWKNFLVSPEPRTIIDALPDIFDSRRVSQAMVMEDVVVVDPNDHTFQVLSKWQVNFNGRAEIEGTEYMLFGFECDNGDKFNLRTRINAVVYRSLKTIDGSDFVSLKPLPLGMKLELECKKG